MSRNYPKQMHLYLRERAYPLRNHAENSLFYFQGYISSTVFDPIFTIHKVCWCNHQKNMFRTRSLLSSIQTIAIESHTLDCGDFNNGPFCLRTHSGIELSSYVGNHWWFLFFFSTLLCVEPLHQLPFHLCIEIQSAVVERTLKWGVKSRLWIWNENNSLCCLEGNLIPRER